MDRLERTKEPGKSAIGLGRSSLRELLVSKSMGEALSSNGVSFEPLIILFVIVDRNGCLSRLL